MSLVTNRTRCRQSSGNWVRQKVTNHETYKENNRTITGRAKSSKQSIMGLPWSGEGPKEYIMGPNND